jgi:hypothetical protein
MARIQGDNILFTFVMFTILMVSYGAAIQTADIQNNMTILFAGWPTFQQTLSALTTPIKGCASWDWGCQAAAGVAQATAFVGAVLAYPGVLFISALSRINAFGNLIAFTTFGSTGSIASIPFGPLFLFGLALIVLISVFRDIRGSPSGL